MARPDRVAEQFGSIDAVSAPPEKQAEFLRLSEMLGGIAAGSGRAVGCRLLGPHGESIRLPPSVFTVLERAVEALARGDAVAVVPVGRELTTQQAADLLNVSRQYLVRLIDEGRIPAVRAGTHRRVRVEDLLAFKALRDDERQTALRDLTRLTEEAGGYEPER